MIPDTCYMIAFIYKPIENDDHTLSVHTLHLHLFTHDCPRRLYLITFFIV
jgi:hypothetical protein